MQLAPANVGYPANTAHGQCYAAGCTNGDAPRLGTDWVIDLQTNIEMEGWLVLCQDCAEQIGELLGMTSDSETKRIRGRVRNLEDELEAAQTELAAMKNRLLQAVHG